MPTPSPAPSSSHRRSRSRDNTVCPQRKHRKLLKVGLRDTSAWPFIDSRVQDGSGSEVWPESLERLFLDGMAVFLIHPRALLITIVFSRIAPVLELSLGNLLPRTEQMAESIPRTRLSLGPCETVY